MQKKNPEFAQAKGSMGGYNLPFLVLKDAHARYYYEDLATADPTDIVLNTDTGFVRVSAIGGGVLMRSSANVSSDQAVAASVTLTLTGAIVPGVHAESIITSDATAPANDSVVVIGDRTYTYKTTLTGAADEVLIGASAATALDNLKSAINATAGAGTTYGTGTVEHADVVATDNTDTTQKIVAKTSGTAANSLATTTDDAHLSWEDTTLGGGTGSSVTGVAGETVVINGTTYTFEDVLTEDYTDAVANQIHFGADSAAALDNLKHVVNGTGTEGTDYSTGSTQPDDVEATTNSDTTQVFKAQTLGTAGNAYEVSDTLSNGAFGSATFAGGSEGANFDAYIHAGETVEFGIDEDVSTISLIALAANTDIAVVEH